MDENNLEDMLSNPFYAITVAKPFSEDHEPLVSEEDWIKANAKLIEEIGAEEWLRLLLNKLRAKQQADVKYQQHDR